MSIVRHANSKYWYMQFQLSGRTYVRSSRTTDKKVALKMEEEWKRKLHAQEHLGHKERITLKVALHQFCESRRGTPNHRGLTVHVGIVCKVISPGKYLDDLTSSDLERFKQSRVAEGISGHTIKHSLNLIGGSIKRAKHLGYQVPDVSMPTVKIPKVSLRYLSIDEEKRLLERLDPRRTGTGLRPFDERSDLIKRQMQDAYDLVVLLLDTGARSGEIANIMWDRIDLRNRTINLWRPKVQNETTLFMTRRVFEILTRRATTRVNEYLFNNNDGGPRGYSSMAIRKAIRGAGLKGVRIHTLRHTHASRLVQNGMSVYEVREILGHTDIKTTMRYAHLEQRDVAFKAREVIDRLNGFVNSGQDNF